MLSPPVPKVQLSQELRASRVMLYRGDINETFCLAVGEAQAMGVPAVVGKLGSVVERVIDGETGFVAEDEEAFADDGIKVPVSDRDEINRKDRGKSAPRLPCGNKPEPPFPR